jgi:hypothetical protein
MALYSQDSEIAKPASPPAFGYSAPHLGAEGTSTLLNKWQMSSVAISFYAIPLPA